MSSRKTFRPYAPRQHLLLPPSLLDWVPEGHLSRFVLDVVEELDLSAIYETYEGDLRGYPPHDPRMMVGLLIYGYCVGVMSSRKIERACIEDVAFRLIAGNTRPDHSRISEFRRRHGAALADLFLQTLRLCQEAGLVKLGHVAIDGTKLKANASKHKAMSYERMKKEENRLEEKVRELLAAADAIDEEEDRRYGKDRRGDELPEELQRAESRKARIRAAKKALEEEAAAAKKRKDDPPPPGPSRELPEHQVPHDAEGKPTGKAQRNFTDPESRIMKTRDGFVQGYNGQIAVDAAHQIIVAQALTNQSPDVEHLLPLVDHLAANLGELPAKVTADAGYFAEASVNWLESLGVEPFIATERQRHGEAPPQVVGRPPADLTAKQRMARKLATEKGRAVYKRRKAIVEPVFGQVKAARGIRQLLRRGLEAARQEWALISMTHNLLKLWRATAA